MLQFKPSNRQPYSGNWEADLVERLREEEWEETEVEENNGDLENARREREAKA